jgi:AcrR family transcriptional regulator
MTFFRHFPTKEAVLMDDPYDDLLAAAVAAQPADLRSLERVRRAILGAWEHLPEPADDQTRARIALVVGHPGLEAAALANTRRTQSVIAEALAASGASRLEREVAAGACLGALTAALFDWAAHDGGGGLGERVRAALALLSAGSASVTEPEAV